MSNNIIKISINNNENPENTSGTLFIKMSYSSLQLVDPMRNSAAKPLDSFLSCAMSKVVFYFSLAMSRATISTSRVLRLPNGRFLFIFLTKTSLANWPAALQTCPNRFRRLLLTYEIIFSPSYNFCSFLYHLLS